MTVHELKTWPEPFQATWDGAKPFEIRSEVDRTFAVGDLLRLREWVPATESYTRREVHAVVGYVSRAAWGLPPGLVVLGLPSWRSHPARAGEPCNCERAS